MTQSAECYEVLRALKERRNVLISGPPAAGKSHLLNEVAAAFVGAAAAPAASRNPVLTPGAKVPIPARPPAPIADATLQAVLPSSDRNDRRVFRTVFHQSSKHRDFLTGIAPDLSTPGAFKVTEGILYRASQHALSSNGASLLIIDEINRGPAVQVFGGAIVAIEGEKRLAPDGSKQSQTQFFELLDPATGSLKEYAFPHHLYILAAMNQADVSVEPLDVAFLRRWAPLSLRPSEKMLRSFLGLAADPQTLPDAPTTHGDVLEAATQAWAKINARIALGRGPEFQIGHGVLMSDPSAKPENLIDAQRFAVAGWNVIRAHIDEVFFGDIRGLAATLNALNKVASHPYELKEVSFADEPKQDLAGPSAVTVDNVYALLKAVAAE